MRNRLKVVGSASKAGIVATTLRFLRIAVGKRSASFERSDNRRIACFCYVQSARGPFLVWQRSDRYRRYTR